MKKSLVVFDMDGTLIDSSHTISGAINYVRQNMGLEPMPHEQIIPKVNDHTINPADYFYGIEEYDPIHEKWFNEYYTQNHATELRLYDGILDLLDNLKVAGADIALATNAYRISTIESIRHFGIEQFFDAVACADDVRQGKPAPDMLYKILKDLGKEHAESVFVGDGPRDEEAAKAAAMDYIMVDWGFTDHDTQKQVVYSVSDLKQRLENTLKQ